MTGFILSSRALNAREERTRFLVQIQTAYNCIYLYYFVALRLQVSLGSQETGVGFSKYLRITLFTDLLFSLMIIEGVCKISRLRLNERERQGRGGGGCHN